MKKCFLKKGRVLKNKLKMMLTETSEKGTFFDVYEKKIRQHEKMLPYRNQERTFFDVYEKKIRQHEKMLPLLPHRN